ncbi:NYN domain-containing protein [candidate division WOR-3 bacterium]|nr:NYN domain-containing protein [candidate division WOR-3 bacterium]
MKKYLIVDGYNLIGKKCADFYSEENREKLIRNIVNFTLSEKYFSIIVFDGKGTTATREKRPGVEVIFSGDKDKADDLIVKIIENGKKDDSYTVLTSDRELSARCKALGAAVAQTQKSISKKKKKTKDFSDKMPQNRTVDFWLKYFNEKGGSDEV